MAAPLNASTATDAAQLTAATTRTRPRSNRVADAVERA